MKSDVLRIRFDKNKTVLSSESSCYKTEYFSNKTRYVDNINFFISKIADSILLRFSDVLLGENFGSIDNVNCFMISTEGKEFSFLIKFGFQLGMEFEKKDIIFFDYVVDENELKRNDQRINDFLLTKKDIVLVVEKHRKYTKKEEFNRVYHLSTIAGINLPKLSLEQKDIVETLDKNVLVQGVAGSGKTNVCIDKIVYTSCRNYSGKVLYSTFSRGLLIDTKSRIDALANELEQFSNEKKNGNVIFVDKEYKKALENRFGIFFFAEDDEIFEKIDKIVDYLRNKVDYFLIEDLYVEKFGRTKEFVDSKYFEEVYTKNLKNYQISKALKRLENFSIEIIYKEIFGMIYGKFDAECPNEIMSFQKYFEERKTSFSKEECESLYQIALDYKKHLEENNYIDNNLASRELYASLGQFESYSLVVLDEVQDFSEVNLSLFKKLSLKMFCVGDALQMINPSYFNFGYLKNLLYEKDVTDVKELKQNYRNTKKIEEIIDALGEINQAQFGTHNFVVRGQSVDDGQKTNAIFVRDEKFAESVASGKFDNFTFIVASGERKKQLRSILKNQEILTVSEIKGLERNTVVVYNVLSDYIDAWRKLEKLYINHKTADENSVYRYYYNLFYVALSRARQNLFVVEKDKICCFDTFFANYFENLGISQSILRISKIVSQIEDSIDDLVDRVREFVKLEQYDNAVFVANKISDDVVRMQELKRISIRETLIRHGRYREAGIQFWQAGMLADARKQFELSKDDKLIKLLDACSGNGVAKLSYDMVDFFDDVKDNEVARNFILMILQDDVDSVKTKFNDIKNKLKNGGR